MDSPRLGYRRIGSDDAATLHALATDEHIKRYLLDGETMDRAWADAEVARSQASFDSGGAGLWLVAERNTETPIGFVGYRVFEELGPEPQLLYAFQESVTGRGYATESAEALIRFARDKLRWDEVVSAVDEPNVASIRVLEKVGFQRTGAVPGAFGKIIVFRLALGARP